VVKVKRVVGISEGRGGVKDCISSINLKLLGISNEQKALLKFALHGGS
jgi:hypothetical protein